MKFQEISSFISPITRLFVGAYICIVTMVYKPTNITGGHHLVLRWAMGLTIPG
jgi:hypothetical protein